MAGPQQKRKKSYGKSKNHKEKEQVVQNKLHHLDELFAGSSAEEDNNSNISENEQEEVQKLESSLLSVQHKLVKRSAIAVIEEDNEKPQKRPRKSETATIQVLLSDDEESEASTDTSGDESALADNDTDSSSLEDDNRNEEDSSVVSKSSSEAEYAILAPTESKAQNMAKAMSRILGIPEEKDKVVVLSKTVTKIQKIQSENRLEQTSLSRKRSERKQINLACMYIPSRINNNSNKQTTLDAQEVQKDRVYRRIATRGVVALFNAISQHQQQTAAGTSGMTNTSTGSLLAEKGGTNNSTTVTSKRAFLDKIKESAAKQQITTTDKTITTQDNCDGTADVASTNKRGWNALKDDYMMGTNNLKVCVNLFFKNVENDFTIC